MAEQAYAYVTLIPVAKGFQREVANQLAGIGGTGGSAGQKAGAGFSKGFGGALKGLAAPLAAAFSGVAIGGFVKDAVGQASNLAESLNAVNVSFGSAAKGIQALGSEAAQSLGLSTQQFNQLAVGFTAFAERIAGPGGDVVGIIDDLTTRGADFASVMNLEVEEALTLFRSGLSGETEPLRRFGIDVSEASTKAFAYANGIAEVGAELTEGEKVQARYGAIMEQTSKMAGDFANTSDGLANAQRILQASFKDVQAEVGAALLPVLAELTTALIPIVEDLTPIFKDLLEALAPVLVNLVENIGPLVDAMTPLFETFNLVVGVVGELLAELLPPLIEIINALAPVVLELVMAFLPLIQQVLPALVSLIETLVPVIQDMADFISEYVVPVVTALSEILGEGLAFALGLAEKAVQDLTTWLGPLFAALKPVLDAILQFVGIKPADLKKTIQVKVKVDSAELKKFEKVNFTGSGGTLDFLQSMGMGGKATSTTSPTPTPSPLAAATGPTKAELKKQAQAVIRSTKDAITGARKELIKAGTEARQDYAESVSDINSSYNKAVDSANQAYSKRASDITKSYDKAIAQATQRRDSSLAQALKDHTSAIANINKEFAQRQADLIAQSMNRLRDAYKSAVQVNVASIFDSQEIAGSVDGLVQTLRDKLAASRQLLGNAAKLASAGFSQTFIEQVVSSGTAVGNEMAEAILTSTPETISELQNLFGSIETEAESGMNALSQQIYDKTGLATTELKRLYAESEVALQEALAAQELLYAETQAQILSEFNTAVTEAQVTMNEALTAAQEALDEAILNAKETRDNALEEAQKKLNEELLKANQNFLDDITKIEKTFKDKVASMKGQVSGLASSISSLSSQLAGLQSSTTAKVQALTPPKVKLAEGGLVTGPTRALIGEAGPEVVIPLDRFESMMGLSQGGQALNYYAAPNLSLDSEQELFTAMKRAKVVVGW